MSYVNLRQNSVKSARSMIFEYASNGNDCVHVQTKQKKKINNNTQNPMRTPIIVK